MRIVISAFAVLLALSPSPLLASASPERTKGISMHMLPKQVADLSGGKLRWGLNVDYADYLKGETVQPIVQSTAEFQTYVQKQTPAVQSNGVWIVLTNPMAYSASETAQQCAASSAARNP